MSPHPWQWLFFAALGAWLTAGATRPAEGAAGRRALAVVGAALLGGAVGACWGELPPH